MQVNFHGGASKVTKTEARMLCGDYFNMVDQVPHASHVALLALVPNEHLESAHSRSFQTLNDPVRQFHHL
jgi:hypothetical protein